MTTSAGIQYEERRLFATQMLGRTLLTGQESPQQAASQTVLSRLEPVRDLGLFGQEEVLLADRRLLLTAGLRADRSSANGNTGQVLLLPQVGGLVPVRAARSAGSTSSSSAPPTARRATGRCSARCYSPDTTGDHRRQLRHLHRRPRRAIPTSSRSGRRSSRPASTPRSPTAARELTLTALPAEHHGPAAGADAGAVQRPGEPRSSARTARCGTGASRRRSRCRRCRART